MLRRVIIVAAGLVLAATATGIALSRSDDDHPTADLTVTWGGSEGHPSCVYDAEDQTVGCTIKIDGEASRPDQVAVTVTAYADENTSEPVGSSTRSVRVDGKLPMSVVVTIPVEKAPHVGEDGETACALSVKY